METFDANELVTVETYYNVIEAALAKGRLNGEGIKSFIFKDDSGGTRPHMQWTLGVDLKVRQSDLVRASDILKSFGTSERKSEELKPGENRAALYSLLAWVLSFIGCGLLVISMSLGKAQFGIGIVILSVGILFGIGSRTSKKKIIAKINHMTCQFRRQPKPSRSGRLK